MVQTGRGGLRKQAAQQTLGEVCFWRDRQFIGRAMKPPFRAKRNAGQSMASVTSQQPASTHPAAPYLGVEVVINLKTAKALGLTIPQSLLLGAEVIE